jgi:4-amino-4-deoxy-L-arabinose transferase-like glycosyltransferase
MRPNIIPHELRWLLLAFILLCLIYAWATPIFEASDELWHFGLVDHLARTWQLPVQVPGEDTAWEQEGSQPPLYHFISALLVSAIDRSDIDTLRQPNPHVKAGIPGASDNKNLVLHDAPYLPLQKTALAVYLVRLFSIGLGAVTVFAVYQSATIVGGNRAALLAAGLTAFNPMFLFITASVNNDNLVTALNSLIIWQMLVMLRDGFKTRRSVVIASLIALAALSKLSGLVLVPIVALAGLYVAYTRRDWRGLVILGTLMLGVWALVAGWWYLRNSTLYGELFGTNTMAAVAGARIGDFTLQTLLSEFQGFRIAYWGLFGAVNIQTFDWFYIVMDGVVTVALVGLIWHIWWNRSQRDYIMPLGLLMLTIAIGAVSVILWTAQTYASQGRLLFPYVAATSSLLAIGISRFVREWRLRVSRINLNLQFVIVLLLFAIASLVPFVSILPQYALPSPVTSIPDSAHQVYARFGDVALVGYETPDVRYQPGDEVPVRVYWKVIEQSEHDYSLFLTLLDDRENSIGKVDTYPGGGRLRTSTWQPGAIYADSYQIPISSDTKGRYVLRMQVGWWDYPTQTYIAATNEANQPLEAVILNVGAFADVTTAPLAGDLAQIEPVTFGGKITLLGYFLTGNNLLLLWECSGTLDDDYTVFVHVLDDQNAIVGQGDAPPQFPTHYWRPGERFLTRHEITYPQRPPTGSYRLVLGWYRPSDFVRLSTSYPDNAFVLREITMGE